MEKEKSRFLKNAAGTYMILKPALRGWQMILG